MLGAFRRGRLSLAYWCRADNVRSAYGIRMRSNFADRTFRLCALGIYGRFFADHLARIDHPFHMIDVGANQGLYAILAAQNPQCRSVLAFEPVPTTADLLVANLALNNVADKVTLQCKALSDRAAQAEICIFGDHSGRASLAQAPTTAGVTGSQAIEMVDHTALEHAAFDPAVPIVVKIDVEGHEEVVISEILKFSGAAQVKHIFYECNEAWIDAPAIVARLRDAGFSLSRIGTGAHYDVLATRP